MENFNQEFTKEIITIKAVIDEYSTAFEDFQEFVDEVLSFNTNKTSYDNINKKIVEEVGGMVEDKNALILKLATKTNLLCRKYRTMARKTDNNQLYKDVNFTKGVIMNMSEGQLIPKCKHLKDLFQTNLVNMGNYNVTPASITEYLEDITSIETKIAAIKLKRQSMKSYFEYRDELIGNLQTNIINFKDLIFEYEVSNEPFFKRMNYALKLVHIPHGEISLIVNTEDSLTKEKIANVDVEIEIGGELIVKKTTILGNTQFRDLPMGRYIIKIKRFDYAEQSHTVDIEPEKLIRLNTKLVKI